MHFEEYQLSPSLISLSLLSTVHPSGLQPTPVRASISYYRDFTLTMDRSLGFGSTPGNLSPISDSLSLRLHLFGFTLLPRRNSLTHYAKGTRSAGHARKRDISLPPLVGLRFQVLFHSPHRGAFHLSLTVLVHYRSPSSI